MNTQNVPSNEEPLDDDFPEEVALVRKNPELMQFLAERSKEGKKYSLDEVKARLGLG